LSILSHFKRYFLSQVKLLSAQSKRYNRDKQESDN
jgi:hypothetical protein